jgi:hypothetical protein
VDRGASLHSTIRPVHTLSRFSTRQMGPKGRIRSTYSSTAIHVHVHLSFIRPVPHCGGMVPDIAAAAPFRGRLVKASNRPLPAIQRLSWTKAPAGDRSGRNASQASNRTGLVHGVCASR